MTQSAKQSKVMDTYRVMHPKSGALYERARNVISGGITHDGRHLNPYPVYIDRALGSRKWDVDGNEYVDYWMGHGALILGHCHPAVVAAIQKQAGRGTHLGASHELEVRWAELVSKLIPSAEMVRFTMSGTEATHLAIRIARAYTNRPKILKFQGHFHGWHDGVALAVDPPYDVPWSAGVPTSTLDQILLCPPNDIKAVDTVLQRGDVAAVILEPTGGHFGSVPMPAAFVRALRTETQRAGTLLIFDEVVTGFRVAPGGAQQLLGVKPDLTTLAKILAGGLPGGAVVGREDVLAFLATRPGQQKVAHHGTFNANPLTAAAGVAMLSAVADGTAIRAANAQAATLRRGLNEILAREQVAWKIYGDHSDWKIFFGAGAPPRDGDDQSVADVDWRRLDAKDPARSRALRQALILQGVDFNGGRGLVSTCHTDDVIKDTIAAFETAIRSMKEEGFA